MFVNQFFYKRMKKRTITEIQKKNNPELRF